MSYASFINRLELRPTRVYETDGTIVIGVAGCKMGFDSEGNDVFANESVTFYLTPEQARQIANEILAGLDAIA